MERAALCMDLSDPIVKNAHLLKGSIRSYYNYVLRVLIHCLEGFSVVNRGKRDICL